MPRIAPDDLLSVGELSRRAGVTPSAVRYYERRGLVRSQRTAGNQREFPRHSLRRLAIIAAGQVAGLTLQEIADALAELPLDRAPSQREWRQLSQHWARLVEARVERLQALQIALDGCIGCGCLSLSRCTLFNPADEASREGPGSRWLRAARPGKDDNGQRVIRNETD